LTDSILGDASAERIRLVIIKSPRRMHLFAAGHANGSVQAGGKLLQSARSAGGAALYRWL